MKVFLLVSCAAALIALPCFSPAARATDIGPAAIQNDDAVARGNGFEITRREMNQVLATANAMNPDDKLPPDADFHVFTHLIEIRLVMNKATEAEKAAGKLKNDLNFTNIVKTLGEAEFERRLKATKMTPEELRLMLFREETAQASLTRQLGIQVSDAEARKYFDANPGVFDQPEKARVRELLLLTTVGYSSNPLPEAAVEAKHKEIYDLHQRVQAGEDFAALAKQYNEDVISKDTGGEITFRREQMEYGDLAFSMKPNQISGVITNEDGYLFFQLLETIPAKKVTFDDVSGRLKNLLAGQQKRLRAPDYIRQLRREANVEILDPKLKAEVAANEAAAAEAAKAQTAQSMTPATETAGVPLAAP